MSESIWLHTDEEIAEAAERGKPFADFLRRLDDGTATPEELAALDEYLDRSEANRCPECGR